MERMREISPRFFSQMQQSMGDPTEKAALFAEDLRKRREGVLLDFWAWDREVSAQPYEAFKGSKGKGAANQGSGSSQG